VEFEQPIMDCTPDEFLEARYIIDLFGDDNDPADDIIRDAQQGIAVEDGVIQISESLPFGTHSITYYVEDMCGNIGSCSHLIELNDCKIPTPYCLNGVATVVMPAIGEIEVWASDLDAGSVDNCGDLQFSFSSDIADSGRVFTCADLENGVSDTFELEMWVTDENGNQDYCETYLIIQDPQDVCPDTGQILISGQTLTMDNKGLENAEIRLERDNAPTPSVYNTDGDGTYRFLGLNAREFRISAFKNDDPLNGVSTWDIALLQMHVLGLRKLTDPYYLIAGNVNDDNKISGSDIIDLRKVILGKTTHFRNNDSWRFVDASESLAENILPRGYDEVIELSNIMSDQPGQDFVAVKIGDLDGSAVPNGLTTGQAVQRGAPLVMSVKDQLVSKGDEVRMEVTAAQFKEVLGYQMTLEYETKAMGFLGIESGEIELDESNIGVFEQNGLLTMSWNETLPQYVADGKQLFTLVFRAEEELRLSESVELSSAITRKEAYVNGQLRDIALRFTDAPLEFALYQNAPNPFNEQTVIGFNLPFDAEAKIMIYDVSGKVVHTIVADYEQGYNQVTIDHIDLPSSGIYYYELICQEFKATKRMILATQ
jgi:hypothetical protein